MKQECHFFGRAGLCLAGLILIAAARDADAKPKYFVCRRMRGAAGPAGALRSGEFGARSGTSTGWLAFDTSSTYGLSSLVKESEASFRVPPCCTYTSVTMKGLVTSLPPTTAIRRILLKTIAVVPMSRTDVSWISTFL